VTSHSTSAAGHRPSILTDALLVTMAVIWGANVSVVKYATGIIDPLAYNALRVSLAAIALCVVALVARSEQARSLTRRDVFWLLVLGVIGNGLYQLGFVEGVAHTRAGDAALVLAASPAMIAIIGRIAGIERIGRRSAIGIGLSILGIGLVVYGTSTATGEGAANTTMLGAAFILAGSVCWAIFSVYLKPFAHRVDGTQIGALTMVGGAIALVLISFREMLRTPWGALSATAWWAIAYSGIGSLVIAYLLWQRGVRVLGPTRTAMYSNLQPIVALVVAWLALGEVPTAWQATGAATIIAGVIMTRG
jgi:drug/metabolite transporter (DMT)-like permease